MNQVHAEAIRSFQQQILSWYDTFKRYLPWRGDHDPYHVLVSEVMLQQTGVARVIPKNPAFLERFPTLQSLADASTSDVIREWQGLGYNRCALNLKRAAEAVVRDHGGLLPASVENLERLPGIGRYTAWAVACFAYGLRVPVVDTNVRRVLSDFAGRALGDREIWELAERILPPGRVLEPGTDGLRGAGEAGNAPAQGESARAICQQQSVLAGTDH